MNPYLKEIRRRLKKAKRKKQLAEAEYLHLLINAVESVCAKYGEGITWTDCDQGILDFTGKEFVVVPMLPGQKVPHVYEEHTDFELRVYIKPCGATQSVHHNIAGTVAAIGPESSVSVNYCVMSEEYFAVFAAGGWP